MVKRKAVDSLDEWLKKGTLAAAPRRLDTKIVAGIDNQIPSSTAEGVPPQTAKGFPTIAPAEVEVSSDKVANRFWSILEQAGYELW